MLSQSVIVKPRTFITVNNAFHNLCSTFYVYMYCRVRFFAIHEPFMVCVCVFFYTFLLVTCGRLYYMYTILHIYYTTCTCNKKECIEKYTYTHHKGLMNDKESNSLLYYSTLMQVERRVNELLQISVCFILL